MQLSAPAGSQFLADWLADRKGNVMAKNRAAARLHLLTVRQVRTVKDGDHGDGGGLLLGVRGDSVAWVFRYTAPSGRRREIGLGPMIDLHASGGTAQPPGRQHRP